MCGYHVVTDVDVTSAPDTPTSRQVAVVTISAVTDRSCVVMISHPGCLSSQAGTKRLDVLDLRGMTIGTHALPQIGRSFKDWTTDDDLNVAILDPPDALDHFLCGLEVGVERGRKHDEISIEKRHTPRDFLVRNIGSETDRAPTGHLEEVRDRADADVVDISRDASQQHGLVRL